MKLIKLDAIDSTNDFLKQMSRSEVIDNFTIVSAKNQLKGKGQMGAIWESEAGKNLTISILIKDLIRDVSEIYNLNIAVALGILSVLKSYEILNLSVKWPNDIMAENCKIGGVLIENVIKHDKKIESVVGIGLNVNQVDFSQLQNATSMCSILGLEFDLNTIIFKIAQEIQLNCTLITMQKQELLWSLYHQNLFKIGVFTLFEEFNKSQFNGIIQGVTLQGKLQILNDKNEIKSYGLKEIKILF